MLIPRHLGSDVSGCTSVFTWDPENSFAKGFLQNSFPSLCRWDMAELLAAIAPPFCLCLPKDSTCSRHNTENTLQALGDVSLGIWDTSISLRGAQLSPLTDLTCRDTGTSWGLQYFNTLTPFFIRPLAYHL